MGTRFELTQESAEELMRALNKAVGDLLERAEENKNKKSATIEAPPPRRTKAPETT